MGLFLGHDDKFWNTIKSDKKNAFFFKKNAFRLQYSQSTIYYNDNINN